MPRITPALSDGRAFTNYVSSGIYNQALERQFGVPNDTSFRHYAQNNADELTRVQNSLLYVRVPTPQPRPLTGQLPGAEVRDTPAPAFAPSQTISGF